MSARSPLSLEKDRFNFAFNLAGDLKEHLRIFGADYSQEVFDGIDRLQARCYSRGIVTIKDLEAGINLMGFAKFRQLSFLAMMKAKLETDYVNSEFALLND